jgi:hypothetical protein
VNWAQRIGGELGLPVYLYEAAATRPERVRLPDIRRGEFEGMLASIHTPARTPDFGPARVGPAGAVVVGARPFLIAYNVYLTTADVAVAKSIAKTIRESSGGLPAVRALGLLVDGQAQVSMNLVDFQPYARPRGLRRHHPPGCGAGRCSGSIGTDRPGAPGGHASSRGPLPQTARFRREPAGGGGDPERDKCQWLMVDC